LIEEINAQSAVVHSLTATVNLEPTTGSVYSGVIKQYHEIPGYILFQKPDWIRVLGQAPVVRTDIFDMASKGQEFQLYVPSQNKFYVGNTSVTTEPRNSLEKLRPEHIIEALVLQPIDPAKDSYFRKDVDEGDSRDYIIGVLGRFKAGEVSLERELWFNRSDLQIFRVQFYGPHGQAREDVRYSNYEHFGSVDYPSRITIERPEEDYSIAITIVKAVFNEPIARAKFVLERPPGAQLVNLGSGQSTGGPNDR
jgi:hypothetical protein